MHSDTFPLHLRFLLIILPLGLLAGCFGDGRGDVKIADARPAAPAAALTLAKTANPTTYENVGDVISYSYVVVNSGDLTVSGPVGVFDDNVDAAATCPAGDLGPNESLTCTASRTVTQNDLDTGSITNVAYATGTDPDGNEVQSPTDTVTVRTKVPPRDTIEDGGFEPPGTADASAADQGCVGGILADSAWTCFNFNFVTSTEGPASGPVSHDAGGTQSMKQFGVDAGAENVIEALEGDFVEASAWAMNWVGDPFNNLAILQLTFWDAPGGRLGGGNQIGVAYETFGDTLGNQPVDLSVIQDGAEVTDWTEMTVSATAPAGTQSAQILLLHVLIDGTPDGGSLFWDDVTLTSTPPDGPPPEFQLVWSDEFDVDGPPSPNNWTIETGYGPNNDGWGNNEWQLYTDDPANIRVENGNLVITARCDAGGPPPDGVEVLQDASFESPNAPDASAGDVGSCGGGTIGAWNYFNCNYVSSNLFMPGGEFVNPAAHDGVQLLKQFGTDAGVFQDAPAAPGDLVNASAYAMNWNGDNFNNIGLLQIFFLDADGNNLSGGFTPAAQVSAGSDAIVGGDFDYVLSGTDGGDPADWTLMEVSAVAPAGTASTRIQMIHILEASTPDGGALWWDDASLMVTPAAPPGECGVRDGTITSGKVNTLNSFTFRYGKIEARIKPPVGKGAWPAFWMLGANFPVVGWPFSGEVDVMEMHNFYSNERTTHFTMHWCDETQQDPNTPDNCFPDGWTYVTAFREFPFSLGDDYHIFEAEWDENGITGKIDGITYFYRQIEPATMEEFLEEFYMILNVAMGGTLGSGELPPDGNETWPQTMLVDYVRVYQAVP